MVEVVAVIAAVTLLYTVAAVCSQSVPLPTTINKITVTLEEENKSITVVHNASYTAAFTEASMVFYWRLCILSSSQKQ
jgi:ABC-type molybdate transport system substrate-binding protein